MIKAEQMENYVHVVFDGDANQNKSELISILIKALSLYSEEDIFQMLAAAEGLIDSDTVFLSPDNDPSDEDLS